MLSVQGGVASLTVSDGSDPWTNSTIGRLNTPPAFTTVTVTEPGDPTRLALVIPGL